jgi:hypothetical protein
MNFVHESLRLDGMSIRLTQQMAVVVVSVLQARQRCFHELSTQQMLHCR